MVFWVLLLAGGALWTFAYVLIIRRGLLDGTYGMPLAALCANLSWEFLFAFVFPQGPVQTPVNVAYFLLDLAILATALIFGPKEFRGLSRRAFYAMLVVGLLTAFFAVYSVTVEFRDYAGLYTAFGQNLMMSLLFLWMVYARGSLRGQSTAIAVLKAAGSAFYSGASWIYAQELGGSVLLPFLFVSILFFDVLYAAIVVRLGKNRSVGFAYVRDER